MSYLLNGRDRFREQAAAGLVRAYEDRLRAVEGGVATLHLDPTKVAIVIGGGSGHFPAFAGLVGPGLADAAVMGDVFASPSAAQVEAVVDEVGAERGTLLVYGNYAGDALNFGIAQQRLRADGVDCRTVVVTDDVASAPLTEAHRRRGIAGGLFVIKIAAAAAARGDGVDAVERLAARANERVVSVGVAYSGATLPGAADPLFTIPTGRIAIGMGIHGEPGLSEMPAPPARELAQQLIEHLVADTATLAGARLAVIVNGLGSVKQEELLVFFNDVAETLELAGAHLVSPAVGEFMTSFEMAGVSLSLAWLDDELEGLWSAPASSVGFSRGVEVARLTVEQAHPSRSARRTNRNRFAPATTPGGLTTLAAVRVALTEVAHTMDLHGDELGDLDSIAGDGDHGIGMRRGSKAAADAATEGRSAKEALDLAGRAWADAAGGTSGALWGVILMTLADSLPDGRVTTEALASAFTRASDAVREVGGANPGDKTMVDSLVPFAETLVAHSSGVLDAAVDAAAQAATSAAQATAALSALTGRARVHGDRGVGSADPGATSFAYAAAAFAGTLT